MSRAPLPSMSHYDAPAALAPHSSAWPAGTDPSGWKQAWPDPPPESAPGGSWPGAAGRPGPAAVHDARAFGPAPVAPPRAPAGAWGPPPPDGEHELELERSIGEAIAASTAQANPPPGPPQPMPPPAQQPMAPQPVPQPQPQQQAPPASWQPAAVPAATGAHAPAPYPTGGHAPAPYPTGSHAPAPGASGAFPAAAMPSGAQPMVPAGAPARPDFTGQHPAQVRQRYQGAENQVRQAGAALIVLGGLYAVIAGMWLGAGGGSMVIGLACTVLTIASLVFGRLLRQLEPDALKWSQAISGIALVYIPFGTACGAYALAMLTKPESRTVLTPEYKAVREATAQMDPPPSIVPWVAATLLVLVGLAQCAF